MPIIFRGFSVRTGLDGARRVAGLRSESVDRDLLEEEAHTKLDHVGKDDVVVFTDFPHGR